MEYEWQDAGEEWSAPWGSSAAQWSGAILPRIGGFLPVPTILEIAPGFGRWTHYLREHCERLHIVDKRACCIQACRRRFGDDAGVSYHVNDGHSLEMIPDRSIDLIFSFDSLVHVPRLTMESYLRQFRDKLTDDGAGFVHHSNLGEYVYLWTGKLPRKAREILIKAKVLVRNHGRAEDMTAELFRGLCATNGLICMRQELVNWRGRWLIDCFSTVARAGSKWEGNYEVLRNPNFMREAELIRRREAKR